MQVLLSERLDEFTTCNHLSSLMAVRKTLELRTVLFREVKELFVQFRVSELFHPSSFSIPNPTPLKEHSGRAQILAQILSTDPVPRAALLNAHV